MYTVKIERNFSSAHFLRQYKGKDEPLHGHNWKVQVAFQGEQLVHPEEYLVDFVEMQAFLEKILKEIDYKNINEVPPFHQINPSSENIARWIFQEFLKSVPNVPIHSVTVWETPEGGATYIREN